MGLADIDGDAFQRFAEIEGGKEIVRRGKENLALDKIAPMLPSSETVVVTRKICATFQAKRSEQYAHADPQRQVLRITTVITVASMTRLDRRG